MQFALIITAEPHFAVITPSKIGALYNVGDDVRGAESGVTTSTERADYALLANAKLPSVDEMNPVEVVQALYASAIACAAGADRFASQFFESVHQKLAAGEAALNGERRSGPPTAPGFAREATVAGKNTRCFAMIASAKFAGDHVFALSALRSASLQTKQGVRPA